MISILGISGSLRAKSYNTALLRAAQALCPPGVTLDVATPHGIPLYDADLEQREGLPATVTELKSRVAACDGLLLATPEYNNGVPGVFKNTLDWLSRPPADIPRLFGGRRVALIGASPGNFGTILAQSGWLPILRTLGTRTWNGGRLLVPHASQVFAEDGQIVDEATRTRLREFLAGFAAFIAAP